MTAAERAALTVRETLTQQYRESGLAEDGGHGARSWTPLRVLRLKLPNFEWRRRALPIHDVHHLLLGYPCTPTGEFQMAAWEFAAGRFPHAAATAFCLPLIGLGAIAAPRKTFEAFVCGRSSQTLYAQGMSAAVLDTPVQTLRQTTLPSTPVRPKLRDVLVYGGWVAASLAWMLTLTAPFIAAVVKCHGTDTPFAAAGKNTATRHAQDPEPDEKLELPFSFWWPLVAGALAGIGLRLVYMGRPGKPYASTSAAARMNSFHTARKPSCACVWSIESARPSLVCRSVGEMDAQQLGGCDPALLPAPQRRPK